MRSCQSSDSPKEMKVFMFIHQAISIYIIFCLRQGSQRHNCILNLLNILTIHLSHNVPLKVTKEESYKGKCVFYKLWFTKQNEGLPTKTIRKRSKMQFEAGLKCWIQSQTFLSTSSRILVLQGFSLDSIWLIRGRVSSSSSGYSLSYLWH